jgi:phosphoribosylformimino-5-aminoimidazole carboxamide ribotide isomerase
MRVVPVLDVRGGESVAAVGGNRSHYRPIASPLHDGSDPIGLARALRRHYGFDHLYLADLDALEGTARPEVGRVAQLLDEGWTVWLDPGIRGARDLEPWRPWLMDPGARLHLIVATETLDGPKSLDALAGQVDPGRLIFSLDLVDGQVRTADGSDWGGADPVEIAGRSHEAGMGRLIVLDVARVGRGAGTGTEALLGRLHRAWPGVELVAGGGIRTPNDLEPLARAGASCALVGTAIHQGQWPVGAGPIFGTTDRIGPACARDSE